MSDRARRAASGGHAGLGWLERSQAEHDAAELYVDAVEEADDGGDQEKASDADEQVEFHQLT